MDTASAAAKVLIGQGFSPANFDAKQKGL